MAEKSRTVLMILYYFPPVASGGTYRPLKFIRYLREFGWNSVIIAPTECRYESQDFSLLQEIPYKTEIIRVKPGVEATWQYSIMRKLKLARYYDDELIPDRHIGFVENAIEAAKRRIKLGGIDLVFTSAPPYSIHLAGMEVAKETGIPWVCDFRDPWVACPFYNPPSAQHDRQNREFEKSYFENASAVIAFPKIRAQREQERYPEFSHKIISIDNGFDPVDFPEQVPEPEKDKIVISHVGAITKDRPVTAFLEVLSTVLCSDKNLKNKIVIEFYGDSRSPTPEDVARLALSEMTNFNGYVSHKDACKAMASSNLLFMVLPELKGADGIMPLRLFEYVYSSRP
ncbi:hypothetical protein KKB99_00135, partial [bacterium]|nr:hypothetical protein [bacterium]MBU1024392.1 hypothetical protein [bacterium]